MGKMPMKKASDLADSMAKHGLSGSIMMGSKMPKKSMSDMMPKDSMSDDDDAPDDSKSEMDMCIDDCADAIMSGADREAIVKSLHDLVDCIKSGDMSQDEDEGM